MNKVLFQFRNILQETIKGSSIEPLAKSLFDLINPPKSPDIINRQDNIRIIKILSQILTKQSNCIDVGCNTGDFLSHILKYSPLGYHYAFEPIPRLATRLRKRFPNTDIREIALSDSEGETTFWYVISCPALSSLKKESWNSYRSNQLTEPITVKTQRLDDILQANFKVDFMKVDAEAAELEIFRGAIQTIKAHKPYIIFEHGQGDSEGNHDERIYNLLVNECNLKIFELEPWLDGLAPLSQNSFCKSSSWNFLATP